MQSTQEQFEENKKAFDGKLWQNPPPTQETPTNIQFSIRISDRPMILHSRKRRKILRWGVEWVIEPIPEISLKNIPIPKTSAPCQTYVRSWRVGRRSCQPSWPLARRRWGQEGRSWSLRCNIIICWWWCKLCCFLNLKFQGTCGGVQTAGGGPPGRKARCLAFAGCISLLPGLVSFGFCLVFAFPFCLTSFLVLVLSLYLFKTCTFQIAQWFSSQEHLCHCPIVHWSRSASLHRSSIRLQIFAIYSGEVIGLTLSDLTFHTLTEWILFCRETWSFFHSSACQRMSTSQTRPVRWAEALVFNLSKILTALEKIWYLALLFFQGLPGTMNFYLESDSGVSVGVWQILPASLVEESEGKGLDWWDTRLGDGR